MTDMFIVVDVIIPTNLDFGIAFPTSFFIFIHNYTSIVVLKFSYLSLSASLVLFIISSLPDKLDYQ